MGGARAGISFDVLLVTVSSFVEGARDAHLEPFCFSRKSGRAVALAFGQGGKAACAQWAILTRFVRTALESIQPPKPFQAEYEGSIPFTRSIPQ